MKTHAQTTTSLFNLIWFLSYISIASVSATIITPALSAIQAHHSLTLSYSVLSLALSWGLLCKQKVAQ